MDFLHSEAPLKVMIKDVVEFTKFNNSWVCLFNGEASKPVKLNKIHIQGEIIKTAGFLKEILIISDGTAKAKVTRGSHVPGDFSWISAGAHCSVIGTVSENGKLPHVNAIKIAKIDNPVLQEMWPIEVLELRNVFLDKVTSCLLNENEE